jgi:serine/threonine protein kinase
MPFEAGTRVGPYEFIAPLGAGGMGEVYRARDTRLDRTVAIKVLTGALAADSESPQPGFARPSTRHFPRVTPQCLPTCLLTASSRNTPRP